MTDKDPCTRCGKKISDRTPMTGRTKGWRWMKKVTTVTTVEHIFRFIMNRWDAMAEDRDDRVHCSYTDLNVCDPCAGEIWTYATADLERQRVEEARRRRDKAQAYIQSTGRDQ